MKLIVAGTAALAAAIATAVCALESPEFRSLERPPVAPVVAIELYDADGPVYRKNTWGSWAQMSGEGRDPRAVRLVDPGELLVHGVAPGQYQITLFRVAWGGHQSTHQGLVRIRRGESRVRAVLSKCPQTFTCMPSTYFPTYYPTTPKPAAPSSGPPTAPSGR
jgi:hypothetical protein